MQTINDLPLESIEHIIDYLHDNPGALQASSLTARSWTDVSQKHLHHCVKFYSGAGRIHDPEAYTSRNVARRVKKLVLSYTPPPTSRTLTAKNIWAIISRLADVTILEMTDFSWTSCTPEMWDIVANTMGRSVNHLIIHTATFQHVQDLLYFLSAFPHLTNLSLSHIEWRESGGAPQETLELSPGRLLRHLRLDWFGSNRVVQDLLDAWVSSFPETLQEAVLGFQWYSFAGIGPLSPYLHAIGPVLAHLKLSLNDCDDGIFRARTSPFTSYVRSGADPSRTQRACSWNAAPSSRQLSSLHSATSSNTRTGAITTTGVETTTGCRTCSLRSGHTISLTLFSA